MSTVDSISSWFLFYAAIEILLVVVLEPVVVMVVVVDYKNV